ncbi:MAG: acyl-CoA dehydrogenase [Deltaproteobacteria bacterium]|nr:MAG: acyl-CoA dehydrogenase [Deltaproteobacteria bacterium]
MDFRLDDEQELLVATLRRFVDKQMAAWASDADRAGAPPDALGPAAAELGLGTDAVPEAAGGTLDGDAAAYSHLSRALRAIELGRGCAALAALLETNVEPALAVARWGSDAARDQLWGSLAAGEVAATVFDRRGRLAVEPDGDGVRITGTTGPVPALAAAAHALVCADGAVALVPAADAEIAPIVPSGWRAARWGTLACDRTPVPADRLLARGDAARAAAAEIRTWYCLNLAARAVGVAAAAMAHAAAYAAERVQFGQPIGTFESIARLQDENDTRVAAARLLVLHAAWQVDAGAAGAADAVSRARDFAAGAVSRATIDAVQIFGGYGFVNDYPVEKLMRDARAFEVLAGEEAFERVVARGPAAG